MLSFVFTCDHCRDQPYFSLAKPAKGWVFLETGEDAFDLILRDIGSTKGLSLLCPACRPRKKFDVTPSASEADQE
jgi:hypothetical protein